MNRAFFAIGGLGSLLAALGVIRYGERAERATPTLALPKPSAGSPTISLPNSGPTDAKSTVLVNPAPYIPLQCYASTREAGATRNPCFTCHTQGERPNFVSDADLQSSYSFAEPARTNHWGNAFVDRGPAVRATPDAQLLAYVRKSNYFDADGGLRLARRLARPPAAWDVDEDGAFGGYVPDAYFDFDQFGFDRDRQGHETGWRVLAYYPLPGAFMPASGGGMGDVLVRLPLPFRKDAEGAFDRTSYVVNFAILAALLVRRDIAIDAVDEQKLGVDLDGDGRLGRASHVRFSWPPEGARRMRWAGLAGRSPEIAAPVAGLLPRGTELLHSVRYLDVSEGRVRMAARMKELRYARKAGYFSYAGLELLAQGENREAQRFPDRLRQVHGDIEHGVDNGLGFRFQGFIEDEQGELRPQTYEESVFCVGCHGGVGRNTDSVFSLARKLPESAFRRGFFHPLERGLSGAPEPKQADGSYEYSAYLQAARGVAELGRDAEMDARFFDARGEAKLAEFELLHHDVERVLLPSPARALALGKAYWAVVREQSYARGREALLAPARAHESTQPDEPTGIEQPLGLLR